MFKFRIVKYITVFVLAFSVLLCNTVYSFAYYPIVKVESDDWSVNHDAIYSAVYPERIDSNYAPHPSLYEMSELNGYTYYGTRVGDDYSQTITYDVDFPTLNITFDETDFAFMFQIGTAVWMFVCTTNKLTFGYAPRFDSSGNFLRYNFCFILEEACTVSLYNCYYPYSKWSFSESRSYSSSDLNKMIVRNWFATASGDVLEPLWISEDAAHKYLPSSNTFDYDSDFYFVAPTYGWFSLQTMYDKTYHLEVLTDVYLFAGSLEFFIPIEDVYFLSSGECCLKLDDFGVIIGSDSSYCHAYYTIDTYKYPSLEKYLSFSLYDGDLFSDQQSSSIRAYDLSYGDYKFHDIISFQCFDYPFDDDPGTQEYIVYLRYLFVSDGINLYFPGTFEIIEFEDYEEEQQHYEVVDAINGAVSSINGQISSSSSALSQEITGAISDMTSDINEQIDIKFDDLMYGDTGYDKPDFDTGDIDNTNSQTDSTLDNLLTQLDSDILDSLPGGYLSFESYFTDSMNTLNTNFSSAFLAVRNIFDRLVSVTDIGILLLFSLIFGFSIFVLGRSLKRG